MINETEILETNHLNKNKTIILLTEDVFHK